MQSHRRPGCRRRASIATAVAPMTPRITPQQGSAHDAEGWSRPAPGQLKAAGFTATAATESRPLIAVRRVRQAKRAATMVFVAGPF